jgi:hypothetical protein
MRKENETIVHLNNIRKRKALLQSICADITVCQKLLRLGVKLDTCFGYQEVMSVERGDKHLLKYFKVGEYNPLPAYTIQQIIGIIPNAIRTNEFCNNNTCDNLASTAANLLIKLIEDNVITVEEINNETN